MHQYAEGMARRTVRDRVAVARRFERATGVPVVSASTADLAAWLGRPELSAASRSTTHSHLRAFFRWAVEAGVVEADPMRPLRAPRRPKYDPRPISEDDLTAVVEGADGALLAMVVLAAYAGLRVSEIARFSGRDLDLSARVLWTTGKGGHRRALPAHDRVVEVARVMPSGWWFPSQRRPGGSGRFARASGHLGGAGDFAAAPSAHVAVWGVGDSARVAAHVRYPVGGGWGGPPRGAGVDAARHVGDDSPLYGGHGWA